VAATPAPGLVPLFEAVHATVLGRPAPPVRIEFYPYVSTKSTIRERGGTVHVRISDHLHDAPDAALRGLLGVLLCRLRRVPESRVDAADRAAYQEALHGRAAERRRTSRQERGRKHIDPVGDHRSLLESYLRVTLDRGLDLEEAPRLSWSRTRSRRRFGHHDADHGCIVISRVLDDPKVPEAVLDYVVPHELLHILHPPRTGATGRRNIHHKAFRDAEARFPDRARMERWLSALAAGRYLR